jgi:hypothetical protein
VTARTEPRNHGRASRRISDGPFAETKEQLAGYYLVECADRQTAIELARQVPVSPGSLVEVRPIPEM